MTDDPILPTQPDSTGPTETRALTAFTVTTGYDQIHLDIGDTRYFVYPELAVELAEVLLRHAAKLRPQTTER